MVLFASVFEGRQSKKNSPSKFCRIFCTKTCTTRSVKSRRIVESVGTLLSDSIPRSVLALTTKCYRNITRFGNSILLIIPQTYWVITLVKQMRFYSLKQSNPADTIIIEKGSFFIFKKKLNKKIFHICSFNFVEDTFVPNSVIGTERCL